MSLATRLAEGITALGLRVSGESRQRLLDYLVLLEKWNATYSLTAVRGRERMLTHHLLDSLAVIPHLQGRAWADIGSGAGLPGIPVALACLDSSVTLVESRQKKTAFLRQAVAELGLRNVTVVCSRVEAWETEQRFDVVISRGVSDLAKFVKLAGRLVGISGVLAAMKGTCPRDELAQLPPRWQVQAVIPLVVPELDAERHLILLRPA